MAFDKPAFVLIHPDDNVLVCCRPCRIGEPVEIDRTAMILGEPIGVGHKIARCALLPGDQVIKYGLPIGSVTQAVAAARHVHGHNMKSDYLRSHTRETASLRKGR
ncbi:UxaA family hydrolase [Sphingomonas sp. AR_OL41]|uniref:UxaA family hydrolase n=1 Tax=Sphingomonas sp. AR_OL41 TaxID=3042729 RepID=UPI0024804CC6|nr:UxaA family hydrolase [Sphingomonas sp. AR_OL41]MDH7973900.1 UxaA family hydrolase [Sphingomonas sp. AR_OL41]